MKQADLPLLNKSIKEGGYDADTQSIKNQLISVSKKIDNITRSLEGGYSESLVERLHQLEQKKASLKAQLQTLTKAIPAIDEKNLKKLKNKLANVLIKSDEPEVREVLATYIEKILVSNESVTVELKI